MEKAARSPPASRLPKRLMALATLLGLAALSGLAAMFFKHGNTRLLAVFAFVTLIGASVLGYTWLRDAQRQTADLTRQRAELMAQNIALKNQLQQVRAHAELEQQRIDAVLRDTGHRIGNSLATVSSLLALQSLRSPSEPVRDAIEAARHRVHAIASSHRRVRSGEDSEVISTDEFLPSVIDDLAGNLLAVDKITISSHVEAISLTTRYATTLSILLSELVTNAIRHAFPNKGGGAIVVRLERQDGIPVLSVIDDGVGMPVGAEARESGLGLVIVRQLAGQFAGTPLYERPSTGGTRIVVSLPRLEAGSASR